MKKILTVCRYGAFTWISSTKIVLIIIYLSVCFWAFIEPYKQFSTQINSPMGFIEPFIIIESQPFSVPLLHLLMIVLICDIPVLDSSSKLVLCRIGKRKWMLGQLLFILLTIFLIQIIIFLTSLLSIADYSFFANGYSLVMRYASQGKSNIAESFIINDSILNQIRPYSIFLHSIILNSLYMLVIGIIQFCFALNSKRLFGLLLNIIVVGSGFCLLYVNSNLKWILPFSHTVYQGHYDTIYNVAYCDIKTSYLYFFILICILIFLAYRITKQCSFHNIEEVD